MLSEAVTEADGGLRTGTTRGENAPDTVRGVAAEDRKRDGAGKPETFNFLGFTHICGTIWKSGKFTVHRKTVGKRMTAKLKDLSAKLRKRMNDPIAETGGWLTQVVRGYFNYHAIPGNLPRLQTFRWTKERFATLVNQYLPEPRILHPYPLDPFTAKYPR